MVRIDRPTVALGVTALAALRAAASYGHDYLSDLPAAFNSSIWAYVSYANPAVAVLPGAFNRSVFDAPHKATTSDEGMTKVNRFLGSTQFIAYDEAFFDIIGPDARVEHVQRLSDEQSHEAACYDAERGRLFFTAWGPPGGVDGTGNHAWQYLLDVRTNELRNVTTRPPTVNVHGCVVAAAAAGGKEEEGGRRRRRQMYVVTDGDEERTGALVRVDPDTLRAEVLLNNYYEQPFMGFNDLDVDSEGNFWLTDSKAAYGRGMIPFANPTQPTVYRVDGRTMQPQVVHVTSGNANGIAVGPRYRTNKSAATSTSTTPDIIDDLAGSGWSHTIYIPDTGASVQRPSRKDPYGKRAVWAYEAESGSGGGGVLGGGRLLNSPVSYFYDGIRASRRGWLFAGAGDGVDVVHPRTGRALGKIRVAGVGGGGGGGLAVNLAFGEHEMWIVGRGGVWHVSGIQERLDRDW